MASRLRKYQLQYIDKIYEQLSELDNSEGIAAPELYVGVLLLYNNINKYSPGKWMNPPKRSEVYKMLETFDFNNDKVLSREEFRAFCEMFFPDVSKKVARDIVTALVITPCLIWLVVDHLPLIKHILPESIIGAIMVAILNATGAFRVLDDFLDRIVPGMKAKPPGAAYPPYGYPSQGAYPPGAYPPGAYPPGAYPPGAPVPGVPAPAPASSKMD